jgi:hypothetical protein
MTRCHSLREVLQDSKGKEESSRGRKQDRARVAGGQDYEVRYEAKKTRKSASAVKKAVKKVGTSRKRVERRLGRQERQPWWWVELMSHLSRCDTSAQRRVSAPTLGPSRVEVQRRIGFGLGMQVCR